MFNYRKEQDDYEDPMYQFACITFLFSLFQKGGLFPI